MYINPGQTKCQEVNRKFEGVLSKRELVKNKLTMISEVVNNYKFHQHVFKSTPSS